MTTSQSLDPSVRSPLAQLLLTRGFTFASVSALVTDCSVTLLDRIALARQPFPLSLARQIQIVTGIDWGTLISMTDLWTESDDPMTRVPVAPDYLLGDPAQPSLTASTQPIVFPSPSLPMPELWVVGDGLGVSSAPGAQAIDRTTGVVVEQVSFVDVVAPVEVVSDGSVLWTFGSGLSGGSSFDATVDPDSGTLIAEADALHTEFLGVAFEPQTQTVWACSATSTSLYRYNPAAGSNPDASVALAVGPKNFQPRDVLAWDGLLYVSAVYPTGVPATPFEGRLFELDPAGLTILRVSTGFDMGNAQGVAADDAGNFWVVSRAGGGTIGPALSEVPTSTFAAAQVPLIADPDTLTDPQWVEYLHGSLWVSDATAPNGRILSVDAGGNVLQSRTFASGSAVGHVAADTYFLWYADKAGGLVHLLDPADVSSSPATVNVGGAPDGLIVLD